MSLVTRTTNIIRRPAVEWPVVAAEPATPASIFTSHVVPLAAIGPIASFVGLSIVGVGIPFVGTYRIGVVAGLTNAVISYAITLLGIVLLAAVVNALAPSFGAQKSWLGALKVTAYASTPAFLACAFSIVPPLAILGLAASLYAIYLMYVGLPVVMGAAKEKVPLYVVSVFGCALVLGVVFGAVAAALRVGTYAATGAFGDAGGGPTERAAARTMAAAVLGNALGDAAARADAVATSRDANARAAAGIGVLKALVTGGRTVAVVPRAELQALLPERFANMRRSDARSERGTFAGIEGSKAHVRFSDAAGEVRIEIADLGNAGGLAAVAGAAANLATSEDDDGYEKNVEVAGLRVHESWQNASKHGDLVTFVDGRFAIEITATGVDMATAVAALRAIDLTRVRELAAART